MMEEQQETKAAEIKKPNPDHTGGWGVVLLEVSWIFVIHMFYPFFSMWAFGESTDSFMYSDTNTFIYFLLVLLPPTALNIFFFINRRKKGRPILRYIVAQIIVLALFALLLTDNYMNF